MDIAGYFANRQFCTQCQPLIQMLWLKSHIYYCLLAAHSGWYNQFWEGTYSQIVGLLSFCPLIGFGDVCRMPMLVILRRPLAGDLYLFIQITTAWLGSLWEGAYGTVAHSLDTCTSCVPWLSAWLCCKPVTPGGPGSWGQYPLGGRTAAWAQVGRCRWAWLSGT